MSNELEQIKKMEEFIQKFDGLTPTNGSEFYIKSMVEEYKECITKLKKYDAKLVEILKLGEYDAAKLAKQEEYPAAIRAYHLAVSTIVGGGILALAVIGVGTSLGGSNPETWSPLVSGIGFGGGALPAIPVSTILAIKQKKNFIDNPEKRNFIEKAIVKKVNKTRAAEAAIVLSINENRGNIISDKPIFTKTVMTKNNKMKTVFTDEINNLPYITRFKIKYLYTQIKKEFKNSDALRAKLEPQVKSVINSKQNKPIITEKLNDRPIIIAEQKISKEEQYQKILIEAFQNNFKNLREDEIRRKIDPIVEAISIKGELKNMSEEDMMKNAIMLIENVKSQIKEKTKKKVPTKKEIVKDIILNESKENSSTEVVQTNRGTLPLSTETNEQKSNSILLGADGNPIKKSR